MLKQWNLIVCCHDDSLHYTIYGIKLAIYIFFMKHDIETMTYIQNTNAHIVIFDRYGRITKCHDHPNGADSADSKHDYGYQRYSDGCDHYLYKRGPKDHQF